MGLFGLIKKQFIDVIDWTETEDGVLSYRYPMEDREIQNGAQLTVRESQLALFVNEGEVADVFTPGRHVLTTKTLPIMTSLHNWDKLFQSPFKSDVYFFSTRDQVNQKWGTPQPVTIRDKEFGPIRVRAFGTYAYRLKNPKVFYKRIAGTRDVYRVEDLEGQLASAILTNIAVHFGKGDVAFLDMAANQMKFSETLKTVLETGFTEYGLELTNFFVQSVSLPEELQKSLDKSSQMRLIGDLQKYAQFQAADSISVAAANPGGIAGAGVGMGAGVAIGQTMAAGLGGAAGGRAASDASEDALQTINKLHDLMKKGVISQAEFDAKKAELLKKIT